MPGEAHYESYSILAESVSLTQAVEHYILAGRVEGKSRKTLQGYREILGAFVRAVGDRDLTELTAWDVRRYLAGLRDRGLSPHTIWTHYRVLHSFARWCLRERLIERSPLDDVPKPRLPKPLPKVLDEEQVAALLRVARSEARSKGKLGVRNLALILLMLDCGLRLSEVIGLRLEDVSLATRTIRVHGKGNRERLVYMGNRTAKTLKAWLQARGVRFYSDHVFLDQKEEPLKPRWVQTIVKCLGERAGIKGLTPHTLRRTSATLAAKNGLGTFELQQLYGWAQIQTAAHYVALAGSALKEASLKASPIDRLLEGR